MFRLESPVVHAEVLVWNIRSLVFLPASVDIGLNMNAFSFEKPEVRSQVIRRACNYGL